MTPGKWHRKLMSISVGIDPQQNSDAVVYTGVDNNGDGWYYWSGSKEWVKLPPLPQELPKTITNGFGAQYLKDAASPDPEPDVLKTGRRVMVYDRYRFAFPLPGEIVKIGGSHDGICVKLLASNSAQYPIRCEVWVHHEQLRLQKGSYDPNDHHKPYSSLNRNSSEQSVIDKGIISKA